MQYASSKILNAQMTPCMYHLTLNMDVPFGKGISGYNKSLLYEISMKIFLLNLLKLILSHGHFHYSTDYVQSIGIVHTFWHK